jgi:hypothetical protein
VDGVKRNLIVLHILRPKNEKIQEALEKIRFLLRVYNSIHQGFNIPSEESKDIQCIGLAISNGEVKMC